MATYPFLFGVMFGDIGHGSLLFLFALYLVLFKDSIYKNHPFMIPFLKARYILLLMGFFATFAGVIYNDFMSKPLKLFDSCWTVTDTDATLIDDCVYPVGVDYQWYYSDELLNYVDSMKMKLSVLYGVMQMTLGITMKAANELFFHRRVEFIFEFIPQIIFLNTLFGYMDLLIVVKWLTDWTGNEGNAPSIITQMINVFLENGEVTGDPLLGTEEFQQTL